MENRRVGWAKPQYDRKSQKISRTSSQENMKQVITSVKYATEKAVLS